MLGYWRSEKCCIRQKEMNIQSNTKKLLNNLGDNCLEKHRYR
jgi:hypothetical protein